MRETVTRGRFAVPLDPRSVEAAWRDEGYSFRPWDDPPGQRWMGFVHATDELVTIAEGRLRVTVGDETVEAEPGDEVFIPRRTVHSVENVGGTRARWFFGYR